MATAVRNLTKMGTDVRKIAALLRAKAPEGHMLAYISPEEAQLLKDRGGSGKPHADTGIPSFELDDDLALQGGGEPLTGVAPSTPNTYGGDVTYGGQPTALPSYDIPESQPIPNVQAGAPETAVATRGLGVPQPISTPTAPQPYVATSADRAALLGEQGYGAAASPTELKAAETPSVPKGRDLGDILGSKLGVAGITGLLGALQARKAGQAGQQGAQDIQKLATPYQQTGQQLQAQAQAGALTPAGQQSLQALQAQVAQGVQARGGVGAQQAQAAVEQLRQQLLQQQYDYGLKLSGIGDNIAIGAIKTGMQADQYANQLTASYFNNIARIAAGTPTATPQVGVPT
jgi:hypothetical protein